MGLLFGDRYINRSTNVVHNHPRELKVNITEKRAPTDESIKLYDEYLEKTKDRVLNVFKIDTGVVEILTVAFMNEANVTDSDTPAIRYFCRFNLNGQQEEFQFKLDNFDVRNLMRQPEHIRDKEILEKVVERASRIIAVRMLKQVKTTQLGLSKDYNLKQ